VEAYAFPVSVDGLEIVASLFAATRDDSSSTTRPDVA
jgi:hypothetical protein